MATQIHTTADDLIADLQDARQVELAVFTDLADDQMLGPQERFLEPPIWEVWHVGWFQEVFAQSLPLDPWHPVVHVNWHEAKAYCVWAERRLPTEAEWEYAASGSDTRCFPWGDTPPTPERVNFDYRHGGPVDVRALPAGDSPFGCRQMIGNVWEWTDSHLKPYPGFVADPYKEYSEPYFGQKPVLRGGG